MGRSIAAVALIVSLFTVSSAAAVVALGESSTLESSATSSCSAVGFDADCLETNTDARGPWYSARAIDQSAEDVSSVPSQVVIPEIGVNSRVVPVGVSHGNALEIPENIDVLGWYRYSASPASALGAMVLVGHRDGAEQGKGALYDLALLQPGDVLEVKDSRDRVTYYAVIARAVISKTEFAKRSEDIFAVAGPKRLRLISCGGYYDAEHGGYQSNVIVTAKPVD